ncbi:amidoligase family protein [Streptomyces noursei]
MFEINKHVESARTKVEHAKKAENPKREAAKRPSRQSGRAGTIMSHQSLPGEFAPGGALPFIQAPVCGGLGSQEGGYAFGLELEFDINLNKVLTEFFSQTMEEAVKHPDFILTLEPLFRILREMSGHAGRGSQMNDNWPDEEFKEFTTAEIVVAAESVVRRCKLMNPANPREVLTDDRYSPERVREIITAANNVLAKFPYAKSKVHTHSMFQQLARAVLGLAAQVIGYQRNVNSRLKIARDLKAAGFTKDASIHPYHAQKDAGYSESSDGWRFEEDGSVNGGEIVSPILYDTRETWEALANVLEIIVRNGGVFSKNTGGHIHVDASAFDGEVEHYRNFIRSVEANQGTLFRLFTDPERLAHRGFNYARPSSSATPRLGRLSDLTRNFGHSRMVNLESVGDGKVKGGRTRPHVEFRIPDGSSDPGVIQARVKACLGIMAAARKGENIPGDFESIDNYRSAGPTEKDASFRRLRDWLYTDPDVAEQLNRLNAVTRYATLPAENATPNSMNG